MGLGMDLAHVISGTVSGSTHTGQDLSQVAATYVSTNVIDLGVKGTAVRGGPLISQFGFGTPMAMLFTVLVAFDAAAGGTMNIRLVSDSVAALSSPTVLQQTGALTTVAADTIFTAGKRIVMWVPPTIPDADQYLGADYVIGTQTTTAGTIFAELVDLRNIQTNGALLF